MNKRAITCLLFCVVLSACGGSSNTPEGSSVFGDDAAPTSGGMTPLFSSPLDVATVQLESVSLTMANTSAQFNDFNGRPLTLPPTGASSYDGGTFAQVGDRERFVGGSFELTLDMVTGTGQGRIAGISMTGPGTQNGLLDFGARLVVRVTAVSGSELRVTISGEFSDQSTFDDQFSEEFLVDATFDARFVDVDGRLGLVGVVQGTIEGETDGLDTFNGVIYAKQGFF